MLSKMPLMSSKISNGSPFKRLGVGVAGGMVTITKVSLSNSIEQ